MSAQEAFNVAAGICLLAQAGFNLMTLFRLRCLESDLEKMRNR